MKAILFFAWWTLGMLLVGAGCRCDRAPSGSGPDAAAEQRPAGDRIVATVNGVPIRQGDVDASRERAELSWSGQQRLGVGERERLSAQILDKMVQDLLLVQHARSSGLSVSSEEVQQRLESIKQSGGGERPFARFVASSGLEPERLRENLERNLLIERLAERLRAEIRLGDGEVAAYYAAHADRFLAPQQVVLAHIRFPAGEGAKERAAKVRAEIEAGLRFELAVERHSLDAHSKSTGGRLGAFALDDLLPVFARAVAALEPGQVSAPVETEDGVHLLKLIERSQAQRRELDEVRSEIEGQLMDTKLKAELERLAERLREEAEVRFH